MIPHTEWTVHHFRQQREWLQTRRSGRASVRNAQARLSSLMVLVTRITAGWRLESEPREPGAPRQLRALRPWSGSSQRCSLERDDLLYLAAVDEPTTGRRGVQNIGRLDAIPRARPRDL
jgi:hypothetical protein